MINYESVSSFDIEYLLVLLSFAEGNVEGGRWRMVKNQKKKKIAGGSERGREWHSRATRIIWLNNV